MNEFVDQFAIDERQDVLVRIDQRNLHIERAEDRRVFDTDYTGANNSEAARQTLYVQDIVGIQNPLAIERNIGRAMRMRADGDDVALRGELRALAFARPHFDRIRIEEARRAVHQIDAIARELVLENFDLVIQRHVQAPAEIGGGDVALDAIAAPVKPALAPAGKIEHRLAQRLRGDRAGVHADAAHAPALVDDEHRLLELGRLNGRPRPPGPEPMTMRS